MYVVARLLGVVVTSRSRVGAFWWADLSFQADYMLTERATPGAMIEAVDGLEFV